MAVMQTYDLKGKKLSFANWISNLSPTETPFVSMTAKEAVTETKFYWQTDSYAKPKNHSVVEGSDVNDTEYSMAQTEVKDNVTQILRKVVSVTDTANLIAAYGRGRELAYQLEKAGLAVKRDLEGILLQYDQAKAEGSSAGARKTASFGKLIAPLNEVSPDTGAIVHNETAIANSVQENDLYNMFYNMYLSNSKANIVMFHPKHAGAFADLQTDPTTGHQKLFTNSDTTFSHYVSTVVDPFGKEWKLVPNRFMPTTALYFFNAKDFTQMVLRAPTRIKLAKRVRLRLG